MIPIDFQFTCSKVKVIPLFSAHCVDRSISFDRFTWSIPNLVQGFPQWVDDPYWFSGHMFKGQGQTNLLSTLYIWILWLLALYRFCFYREDKREICTKGGIDVSETFFVWTGFSGERCGPWLSCYLKYHLRLFNNIFIHSACSCVFITMHIVHKIF